MNKLILLCCLFSFSSVAEYKLPPLHHVVDVEASINISIPDSFPTNKKGQIDCNTCHAVKDIKDIPLDEVDKNVKDFFRGGAYSSLSDFCYQCHQKKGYKRENIHQLIDADGELKKQKCLFCHVETPDPKSDYQREDFKFRVPPQKLCIGCHLKTPHINANTHLLEVNDEMLERIRKYEKKNQLSIPLDGKRITCISCHTVHEKGVLDNQKLAAKQVQEQDIEMGVGYEQHSWNKVVQKDKKSRLQKLYKDSDKKIEITYQRLTHEILIRLPAKDGSLCMVCHKFD